MGSASVYLQSFSQNPRVGTNKASLEMFGGQGENCISDSLRCEHEAVVTLRVTVCALLGSRQFERHGTVLGSDREGVYTLPYYASPSFSSDVDVVPAIL